MSSLSNKLTKLSKNCLCKHHRILRSLKIIICLQEIFVISYVTSKSHFISTSLLSHNEIENLFLKHDLSIYLPSFS